MKLCPAPGFVHSAQTCFGVPTWETASPNRSQGQPQPSTAPQPRPQSLLRAETFIVAYEWQHRCVSWGNMRYGAKPTCRTEPCARETSTATPHLPAPRTSVCLSVCLLPAAPGCKSHRCCPLKRLMGNVSLLTRFNYHPLPKQIAKKPGANWRRGRSEGRGTAGCHQAKGTHGLALGPLSGASQTQVLPVCLGLGSEKALPAAPISSTGDFDKQKRLKGKIFPCLTAHWLCPGRAGQAGSTTWGYKSREASQNRPRGPGANVRPGLRPSLCCRMQAQLGAPAAHHDGAAMAVPQRVPKAVPKALGQRQEFSLMVDEK